MVDRQEPGVMLTSSQSRRLWINNRKRDSQGGFYSHLQKRQLQCRYRWPLKTLDLSSNSCKQPNTYHIWLSTYAKVGFIPHFRIGDGREWRVTTVQQERRCSAVRLLKQGVQRRKSSPGILCHAEGRAEAASPQRNLCPGRDFPWPVDEHVCFLLFFSLFPINLELLQRRQREVLSPQFGQTVKKSIYSYQLISYFP